MNCRSPSYCNICDSVRVKNCNSNKYTNKTSLSKYYDCIEYDESKFH